MTGKTMTGESGGRELLSFLVDGQEFCLDVIAVRELRGWSVATPLPRTPGYVRGVINLRGTVLPIIDMAARLGLVSSEPGARHVVIVVAANGRLVGLLVDAVCEILVAPKDNLQPAPDLGDDSAQPFVRELVAFDDRIVGLLSLEEILPPEAEVA